MFGRKILIFINITALIADLFLTTACSSAPKRSMEENKIYNAATSLLESANSNILVGNYDKASLLLSEACKNAMSIDNYDLLTSITLTRVSLCLSYETPELTEAKIVLEQAKSYADYSENKEKLLALCTLSEARIAIADKDVETTNLDRILQELNSCQKVLKDDAYNEAHFLTASGDIYKIKGNYEEAEKKYSAAAKSFTDNCYLFEIGITWYKIAQVRSLGSNKQEALKALDNAIKFDRLAENSLALGTDYYAKGLVLLKGNPSQKEKDEASYAFMHSADIFEASGFADLAERSRNYIQEL